MASPFSALIKDTAVYGLSSMLGRFLNWLLTYFYAKLLLPEGMGQMAEIYAWTAILLVILTYGMETTFFRFVNKSNQPRQVYSTTLWAVGLSSLAFMIGGALCSVEIGRYLLGDTGTMIYSTDATLFALLLVFIASLDAFCAIPLAYLRYAQRPWRFMFVRMSFVLWTIVATISLYLCGSYAPHWAISQYFSEHTLLVILGINAIGCVLQLLLLIPHLSYASGRFDFRLFGEMLRYALPILLLGLVGAFNNQIDKIIFPKLFDNPQEGQIQLGIYATCYKIAVVMVLFTQAFRYAYDPFVFAKAKEGGEIAKGIYAESMKYYLLFSLFIFLSVMSFLDILKHFVTPAYYEGLPAVPLVMLGQIFTGIYFNLSLWYKLTDRTHWGAILSVLGCLSTILWIVFGAEYMGFMACAWAVLASNALIMVLSYFLGQRYYPIAYPMRSMLFYFAFVLSLWACESLFKDWVASESNLLSLFFNGLMLLLFVSVVVWREIPKTTVNHLIARLKSKR